MYHYHAFKSVTTTWQFSCAWKRILFWENLNQILRLKNLWDFHISSTFSKQFPLPLFVFSTPTASGRNPYLSMQICCCPVCILWSLVIYYVMLFCQVFWDILYIILYTLHDSRMKFMTYSIFDCIMYTFTHIPVLLTASEFDLMYVGQSADQPNK